MKKLLTIEHGKGRGYTQIFKQEENDRLVVVIKGDNAEIIGLNFQHGLECLEDQFMKPCNLLTEIYNKANEYANASKIEWMSIDRAIEIYLAITMNHNSIKIEY